MKMYILVKETVPFWVLLLGVAHAPIACYRKFQDHPDMKAWAEGTFFKVICKVTDEQFEQAKTIEDHVVLTESKFDGKETTIVLRPREEWPTFVKYFSLYKKAPAE